jgi:fructose 1,6-bisphosphatase
LIDNVFEFKEIGKPFTSAVINMFLEMEIGQTIHIPLYDRDGDGDVLFRLYRVSREINQFKFEVIDVSPEAHLLMENPDTMVETEFEDSLGSVPPYVIKRVIDMLNHMMLKLCISGSMGGTGGTSRKRRKTKTMTKRKGQRKGTRKNKH